MDESSGHSRNWKKLRVMATQTVRWGVPKGKDGKACRGQTTKGLDCCIQESCLYSKENEKPLRDFKQWRDLFSVEF